MDKKDIKMITEENERLTIELNNQKHELIKKENERYIDNLLHNGRLFPSQKDKALDLLNIATGYDNNQVITLSEGETVENKVKDLLSSLNVINLSMQTPSIELSKNPYKNPLWDMEEDNNDPEALHRKIKKYMQLHNVDYKTAFNKISQGETK